MNVKMAENSNTTTMLKPRKKENSFVNDHVNNWWNIVRPQYNNGSTHKKIFTDKKTAFK